MIGMKDVAKQVVSLVNTAEYNKNRKAQGLAVKESPNHLIMSGNPGTGKTTVAESIAQLYNALGILPKDTILKTDAGDLIGQYANQVEQNVTKEFNKAKGGVLFIDEAYQLADSEEGRRAATQLMKLMEENKKDTAVIIAGYPGEIERLLDVNPGFNSRFPKTINFPDYSPKEQAQILNKFMVDNNDSFDSEKAAKEAMKGIKALHTARVNTKYNGNARDMDNLHSYLTEARVNRLAGQKPSREDLTKFTVSDVKVALSEMGVSGTSSGKLVQR